MEFLFGTIFGIAIGLVIGPKMDYADFLAMEEQKQKDKP